MQKEQISLKYFKFRESIQIFVQIRWSWNIYIFSKPRVWTVTLHLKLKNIFFWLTNTNSSNKYCFVYVLHQQKFLEELVYNTSFINNKTNFINTKAKKQFLKFIFCVLPVNRFTCVLQFFHLIYIDPKTLHTYPFFFVQISPWALMLFLTICMPIFGHWNVIELFQIVCQKIKLFIVSMLYSKLKP